MRLKKVFISKYKNLEDFTLEFDGDSFIDVFVGKNGTGKSNFFEALIQIFRHIYEHTAKGFTPGFDYSINYTMDDEETEIGWKDEVISINGVKSPKLRIIPMPGNVLVYYSGHNDTVADLVKEYETAFQKRIKRADLDEKRFFIGIGPEYKELLLATILIQVNANKARQYICDKLGINTIDQELKLVLERPSYAKGSSKSKYDIERNDESDRYWKPEGITKKFLDRLSGCISKAVDGKERAEGYFSNDDQYILYFNVSVIRKEFSDFSAQELFGQFDNLKTLGMLKEISIPLQLTNGLDATIAHFSDGQFQSVYIYSIVELFKDRNCITLLDEPDAFLHPEWQFEFLKQVFDITDTAARNNHVLMCSHSAVTLIPHNNQMIKFFDIKNHHANCYPLPKGVAIKKLSSDLIRYSENERILSILNDIKTEPKPVLFTEGITDVTIIREAWGKLYDTTMPFSLMPTLSCKQLTPLMTYDRIHSELGGHPVFGLFDFDRAFDYWNNLKGEILVNDPMLGLIKKWEGGNSYAVMLPVPKNEEIRRQVINPATNETFGGNSCCEIEHLFFGQNGAKKYFRSEPSPGGEKIVFVSDDQKKMFAEVVVPLCGTACFEIFRPMFEFIMEKCPKEAAAQEA